MSSSTIDARAGELRARRSPFVLAVVVRAERPTSAKPGDRAIVLPDGTIEGFVGGSCAESTVRVQSVRQLEAGVSTLLRITPGGGGTTCEPAAPGLVVVDNECLSGGTIEVFSEGPGRGSEFVVLLPCRVSEAAQPVSAAPSSVSSGPWISAQYARTEGKSMG